MDGVQLATGSYYSYKLKLMLFPKISYIIASYAASIHNWQQPMIKKLAGYIKEI